MQNVVSDLVSLLLFLTYGVISSSSLLPAPLLRFLFVGVLQDTSGLETRRKMSLLQEWTDELQAEAQATERLRWSWRIPTAPTLEHATEVRRRAGRRGRFVSRLLHSCRHKQNRLCTHHDELWQFFFVQFFRDERTKRVRAVYAPLIEICRHFSFIRKKQQTPIRHEFFLQISMMIG